MRRIGIPLAAMLLTIALATALGSQAWAQTYPPPVGSLTVASSDTTPSPGECVELTGTVLDNAGNPTANQNVTFTIVSQPGNDASLSSQTAATDPNGVARVSLCAGSTAGNVIVQVVAGDKTSQLTIQVLGAQLPPTGGSPPQDDEGLAYWLIALIVGGVATAGGVLTIVARRRFKA